MSHFLTWSHYFEILKCDDPLEMQFYLKQCINEGWKVRELNRQMKSCLFQRLALSTDKEGVLALVNEGHQEEASSLYFISHPTLFLLNIFNTTKYTIRQFSKFKSL